MYRPNYTKSKRNYFYSKIDLTSNRIPKEKKISYETASNKQAGKKTTKMVNSACSMIGGIVDRIAKNIIKGLW